MISSKSLVRDDDRASPGSDDVLWSADLVRREQEDSQRLLDSVTGFCLGYLESPEWSGF
jgi:hypothetical protein